MPRLLTALVIAAYLVVAVLPLGSRALGLREQHINGSRAPAKQPELSLSAVLDEKFQHGFTAWFENGRGLVGHAVYLDNHVLYYGFGETRVGARVRLGLGKVLFIDEDIDYLNRREHQIPPPAELDRLADSIARVQGLLRARGKSMIPLIIPSKTSLYRDRVDPRWIRDFGGQFPSDVHIYRALVAALRARGVDFVDMRAELTSGKVTRTDIWGPEARHWSAYAACLAVQQVVEHHARLLGGPPLPYQCKLAHEPATRQHDDYDLWRLLNVWKVKRASFQVPIAVHDEPVGAPAPLPRALFVGTSFNWALIRDAERSKLLAPVHMHYYDSQLITAPTNASVPMASGSPEWRAVMRDKDLIVLDLLETALYSGHVYLDNFLRHSEALAAELPVPAPAPAPAP